MSTSSRSSPHSSATRTPVAYSTSSRARSRGHRVAGRRGRCGRAASSIAAASARARWGGSDRLLAGRAQAGGGVGRHPSGALGPGEEHPDGGRAPLQGGPGLAAGLLAGQPAAQRPDGDGVQGRQPQPLEVAQQPGDVAGVGADGVRGQLALQPQVAAVVLHQRAEPGAQGLLAVGGARVLGGHVSPSPGPPVRASRHSARPCGPATPGAAQELWYPGAMQPAVGTTLPGQVVIGGYTPDRTGTPSGSPRCAPARRRRAGRGRLPGAAQPHLPGGPPRPAVAVRGRRGRRRPGEQRAVEDDGGLTLLSTQATGGSGELPRALAADGRHVLVATTARAPCAASPSVTTAGSPRGPVLALRGLRPDAERQEGPHAHQVVVDGDEVLVADLGTDQVLRLRVGADGDCRRPAPPCRCRPARDRGTWSSRGPPGRRHRAERRALAGPSRLRRRLDRGRPVPCAATTGDGELYPSALRPTATPCWWPTADRHRRDVRAGLEAGTLRLLEERRAAAAGPGTSSSPTTCCGWRTRPTTVTVLRRGGGDGGGDGDAEPVLLLATPAPACILLGPAGVDG